MTTLTMYTDDKFRRILAVGGVKYLCPPYDFCGQSTEGGGYAIKVDGVVFNMPVDLEKLISILEIADHDSKCERVWGVLEDGPPELGYPREGFSPCDCVHRARQMVDATSFKDAP